MNINLGTFDLLNKNLQDSERINLVYFGRKFNSKEVLDIVLRNARFLRERCGVAKGDSVGIMLPNIPQCIFSFYSVNAVGGIANLIDPRVGHGMLNSILKETNTKVLFIFDGIYKKFKKHLPKGLKIIVCSAYTYIKPISFFSYFQALYSHETYFRDTLFLGPLEKNELSDGDGEDCAVYIHSAGTTGKQKTVMLSSRAINSISEGLKETILGGRDINSVDYSMLMVLPISHGFGAGVCAHTFVANNQRVILMPKFVPKNANKLIKKYKITHLAGIPSMYRKMAAEDNFVESVQSLEHVFCGGDRLDQKFKEEFDKKVSLSGSKASIEEGYGLTEVVTVCSVNLDNTPPKKGLSSQGKAIHGAQFKIVVDGVDVGFDKEGEIYVKTPAIMSGYLNDEEETKKAMVDFEGEKWIATGDMGKLDAEGNIYFMDRIKRSIKIGGNNVFPAQIEQVVCSLPFVKNCCAVRRKNEEGKPYIELLVIEKYPEANAEDIITKKVAEDIIVYAVPRKITKVDKIRLTNVGKVDYASYEKEE